MEASDCFGNLSTPKCPEDPIFARLVGRLRPKANESHGRQSSSTHVGFAIGKNADGSWRTTRLKEYPSVPNPAAQLSQYVAMDVKEYGCTFGGRRCWSALAFLVQNLNS